MNQWLSDILNLFYPPQCHICGGDLSPHERFLCPRCLQGLPRTGYHRDPQNQMVQRFAGQFPFETATGHFFYSRDSSLSQLIQDMKYRGFSKIGDFLGEICGKELYYTGYLYDIELIVPIPMHFIKKAKRGYNQTENIAGGISKITGIPICNALKMTRQRNTQTALSKKERLENAEGLFQVKTNLNLNNKHLLLVDDVCTTGSTIGSAAKTLTEVFPDCKLHLFTVGVTF